MLNYNHIKIDNGIEIIHFKNPDIKSVYIECQCNLGSNHESINELGLTHLVEHMMLTSTDKYANKSELSYSTEYKGAHYNGATSNRYVRLYIHLPASEVEFGLDFIDQVVFKPKFTIENLNNQKKIIIDELDKWINSKSYELTEFIAKNFAQNEYTKKHFTSSLGNKQTLDSFTLQQVTNKYEYLFQPKNLVFYINGNVDIELISDFINQIRSKVNKLEYNNADNTNINDLISFNYKNVMPLDSVKSNLLEVVFSIEMNKVKRFDSKDRIVRDLVLDPLIGQRTSRINQLLREKYNYLYSMTDGINILDEKGIYELRFSINPENFKPAFKIFIEEILNFFRTGITIEELEHYKKYRINRFIMSNDTDDQVFRNLYLDQTIEKSNIYTFEELIEYLECLSISDVNDYLFTHFNIQNFNLILYGNLGDKNLREANLNTANKVCQNFYD